MRREVSMHPSSITYWIRDLLATQRVTQPLSAGNEALQGLLRRLGLLPSSASMDVLYAVVLVLGLIVASRVSRRFGLLPGVVVCACVGLIVSPVSWSQHYVWIIPVLCWILASHLRVMNKLLLLVVLALVFGWPPLWAQRDAPVSGNWWFFLQADSYVLTAVCFVVVMALLVVRNERATELAGCDHDPALGHVSSTPGELRRASEHHPAARCGQIEIRRSSRLITSRLRDESLRRDSAEKRRLAYRRVRHTASR